MTITWPLPEICKIGVGALGRVPVGLERRVKESQTMDRRLQHSWSRLEYWEESWKSNEIYRHSDSRERLPVKTGIKKNCEKWNLHKCWFLVLLLYLMACQSLLAI